MDRTTHFLSFCFSFSFFFILRIHPRREFFRDLDVQKYTYRLAYGPFCIIDNLVPLSPPSQLFRVFSDVFARPNSHELGVDSSARLFSRRGRVTDKMGTDSHLQHLGTRIRDIGLMFPRADPLLSLT